MNKNIENIKERLKNTVKWFNSLSLESLKGLRYTLFFVIIADIFGLYWYLRLKSFSIAIMMVSIVVLAIILIRESVLRNEIEADKILKGGYFKKKMPKQKKKSSDDEEEEEDDERGEPDYDKKKEKEDDLGFNLDIGLSSKNTGLPEPEEHQKRMKKALGSMEFGF